MNSMNAPPQPQCIGWHHPQTQHWDSSSYPLPGPAGWIAFPPPCQSRAPRCWTLLAEPPLPNPLGLSSLGCPLASEPQPPRLSQPQPQARLLLPLVTRVIISWLVLVQHQSFLNVGAVPQWGFFTHILRLFWRWKQKAGLELR